MNIFHFLKLLRRSEVGGESNFSPSFPLSRKNSIQRQEKRWDRDLEMITATIY